MREPLFVRGDAAATDAYQEVTRGVGTVRPEQLFDGHDYLDTPRRAIEHFRPFVTEGVVEQWNSDDRVSFGADLKCP